MNDRAAEDTIPPQRHVTINQIVALNVARIRRDAGMTQGQLEQQMRWPEKTASAAETSWRPGHRARQFDAQDLIMLAQVLGVPLAALFLPPGDDGEGVTYTWGERSSMESLLFRLLGDTAEESPQMDAYRDRMREAITRYAHEPGWGGYIADWVAEAGIRADALQRLQALRDALLDAESELGQIADAMKERRQS